MADTLPDLDFSIPQGDTADVLFPGVNFSENIDPEIEAGLSFDFPDEKVQEVPAPEALPSLPQLEVPVSSAPDPSHELFAQQSQFVDPRQLDLVPQPTYINTNIIDASNLGVSWPNNQQPLGNVLTTNPAFIPQPLDNQGHLQYFPMGPQLQSQHPVYQQQAPPQIIGQQLFQGPMITHMGHQPMAYGPPIMRMPMNNQPMVHQQPVGHQQPAGHQLNHQPVMYQQPMNPVPQAPWPPQRQQTPQLNPPPLAPRRASPPGPRRSPKPGREGGKTAAPNDRNPSSVPEPIDRSLHSKQPPSAGTVTTSPPLKRPAKNHYGEPLLNDKIPRKTHRKLAQDDVEPERYYGPSPPKPRDWGPRDEKGRHLFTYTEKGELTAGLFLSAHQMRQYLIGPLHGEDFEPPPRLPGVKSSRRKVRQGLTLWIGWPAAMANARYPRGGESTKCRFQNCQYGNTIAVGDPWVILDERQNVDGEMIDPFHNAGYVHLYCLEHHFDLIDLWHLIDIRPDYRAFKRESHPYFSLEYKLSGIDVELRTWWIATYELWWHLKSHGRKRVRDHPTSLAQCLINFKLEHEPKALARNREKRGGADMAKHRGNPELKRKLKAYKKHGLLDEMGFPVADAAARLHAIQNHNKRRRKSSPNPGLVRPPHPMPVQNARPQFPAYVQQVEPVTYPMEPIYQPAFVPPNQYGYGMQVPQMPFEMAAGQKRGYDATVAANAPSTTSSPKRRRLGAIASPPVPQNAPAVTAVPAGVAGAGMQGELYGYNTAPQIGGSADFPIIIEADPGIDVQQTIPNLDLEARSGVSGVQQREAQAGVEENSINAAAGDANVQQQQQQQQIDVSPHMDVSRPHIEVSPPASLPPPHDVSQGQQQDEIPVESGEPADRSPATTQAAGSSDSDSLFGKPGDYDGGSGKSPSKPSASPKGGRSPTLSPPPPPLKPDAFPSS